MDHDINEKIKETEGYIRRRTSLSPAIGLILGSGLGDIAESSRDDVVFSYDELPHFVRSTVQGHAGKLILGEFYGKPSIVMQGRFHYYEGYSLQQVTYPVYLMKSMGVRHLIVTAAAGGINEKYRPGDLVLIKDHINLLGDNPLRGPHYASFGERFPDMSRIYGKDLRSYALAAARRSRVAAHEGVYLMIQGPSYETPAEVRFFRKIGADMVGMSVVPETIVAHQLGMGVLGIAYISNLAAGVSSKKFSHREIVETGMTIASKLAKVLEGTVQNV